MALRFLLLVTCLYFAAPLLAQQGSWKKLTKTADQLYTNGSYEEAANHYLEAYQQKKSKIEFLERAADCYSKLRFYKKAANFYKEVVDHQDFPMAGFHYANSLKQNGEYEEAILAFKKFIGSYKGTDHEHYIQVIDNEIAGCELALSAKTTDQNLVIEHLSENVNTMADEVAPLPFNDDILYFSSTMEGFAKIFRSQFQGGEWSKAILPNFPKFNDLHVCHGTFTPDHQRFYFTLCNNTAFDVIESQCDLYVTVRENNEWSTPRKLRDYIKLGGTTATHPYVMYEDKMEVLYFSSDRKGGKGGMDIWFMTRHIDSPEYDFTLPKNAGSNVNTFGDEVSPFYEETDGILYFSSNGHPSMGGFDVFQSKGSMSKFSKPQNFGKPVNSSADDYYFIEKKSKTGFFVASNRAYGSEKISTDNDDLFYFSAPVKEIFARGNIYDKSNNSIINDVQVILYEIKPSGGKRLLQSIVANNGTYQFPLIPERSFQMEILKTGYEIATYSFNTIAFDPDKEYGKAIYMEKEAMYSNSEAPVFKAATSTVSVDRVIDASVTVEEAPVLVESNPVVIESSIDNTSNPAPVNTTTTTPAYEEIYVNSTYQDMDVTTSAPRKDGVYFKVQISTAAYFNESDPMFDTVRYYGAFQTENIVDKGWTRVLLSDYPSLREARTIMEDARANGFPEAFVVKYRNGRRLN